MTTNFPPDQTLQYQSQPPSSGRPTSVTVLAIIGIILGAIGVVCSPFALVPYFVKVGPPNPVIDSIKNDHAILGYLIASMIVGCIFNIILLASSIGALTLKEWARKGMLLYGWAAIVLAVIGWIVSGFWIYPKMWHALSTSGGNPGGFIGGIIGGGIAVLYPIFVVVYMKKPHVIEAFLNAETPGAQNPYQPPR